MVKSCNEWDTLKEVFVGNIENANNPMKGKDLHCINYADKPNIDDIYEGYYPEQVIEETKEDLEELVSTLKSFRVTVKRPTTQDNSKPFLSNGEWMSDGYYNYCPRDSVTVIGDTIIESPMTLRSRYFETFSFRDDFIDYMKKGARWISAPKPMLRDELYDRSDLSQLTLKEIEPIFDAANILRCNDDILYLLSNTGNKLGAQWLQNFLGNEYRVHILENMYSYSHLDSTMALLREGLCLLNPDRVNEDNMPELLKSWDKIWCPEMVDIGYYGEFNHASVWIGINLLSLNSNLVICDENQKELHKELYKHNIEVIPMKLRHSRTLGGSFHCTTLDIWREE
jgi:glycine amidinotransferase/scyllo-inosamine-4-phosphate amidinotransferase 1